MLSWLTVVNRGTFAEPGEKLAAFPTFVAHPSYV